MLFQDQFKLLQVPLMVGTQPCPVCPSTLASEASEGMIMPFTCRERKVEEVTLPLLPPQLLPLAPVLSPVPDPAHTDHLG